MTSIKFYQDSLPKLSLGTVQFGLEYGVANKKGKPSQNDVNKIIDYVYESSINCFDTAQAYGNSEKVLGLALKNKKNIFIISKIKSNLFISNPIENVNSSLKNLDQNSLYGLLLHDSDLLYKWDEKYTQTVKKLKEDKKIKYFGVSIYSNEDFQLALNNNSISIIQIPFNLFDQRALTNNWIEKAKKRNKLLFIRSVFLQGLILMEENQLPNKLQKAQKYISKLNKIIKDLNTTKANLALNFVNSVTPDCILLFGCEELSQAKENINNFNSLKPLTTLEIDTLQKAFSSIEEDIYNPTKW